MSMTQNDRRPKSPQRNASFFLAPPPRWGLPTMTPNFSTLKAARGSHSQCSGRVWLYAHGSFCRGLGGFNESTFPQEKSEAKVISNCPLYHRIKELIVDRSFLIQLHQQQIFDKCLITWWVQVGLTWKRRQAPVIPLFHPVPFPSLREIAMLTTETYYSDHGLNKGREFWIENHLCGIHVLRCLWGSDVLDIHEIHKFALLVHVFCFYIGWFSETD